MNATIEKRLGSEHNAWREEHAMWLDEMSHWQTEHQDAVFVLERFEAILCAHADAVRQHARAVESHAQALKDNGAMDRHRKLAAEHVQQREMHDKIFVRHEAAMAHLRLLLEAITEPVTEDQDAA